MDINCIFCKIAHKHIKSHILYEDDDVLAFPDIQPAAKVHLLVIPKIHISTLADVEDEHLPILGKMLRIANQLAVENGSPEGCRVIINNRTIGLQEVMHLHVHILGGDKPLGRMLADSSTSLHQ